MMVISDYVPYFWALRVYHQKFPQGQRGTRDALRFLRTQLDALQTEQSRKAYNNFINKEKHKHVRPVGKS